MSGETALRIEKLQEMDGTEFSKLKARSRSPIYVASDEAVFLTTTDFPVDAVASTCGEKLMQGISSIATRTPVGEQVKPPSAASRRPPLLPAKESERKRNMPRVSTTNSSNCDFINYINSSNKI
ncbi:hypothetical protein HHI36_016866 [Cryptolaemus montrouzieri]|uniref:Uncharacterized protein n=1 Tax=Cryptolaemus montrouzieri TaxID=559131 RepID=A0ABD2NL10_9CUCU